MSVLCVVSQTLAMVIRIRIRISYRWAPSQRYAVPYRRDIAIILMRTNPMMRPTSS
jgi:hypothetical protein